jgi:hypothetical protein
MQNNHDNVHKRTKHASTMYRERVDGQALQALQDTVSSVCISTTIMYDYHYYIVSL